MTPAIDTAASSSEEGLQGLAPEILIHAFRLMYTSRRIDDREVPLQRQMPSHWSDPEKHIVAGSSPTGTHYGQAVGCAHANRYLGREGVVTLVSSGEGATSEGEFWEAMNAACLTRASVLFLVEDNGFAISVPVERQTAGGSISEVVSGFPGLLRLEVDGTDLLASFRTMQQAADYCRQG